MWRPFAGSFVEHSLDSFIIKHEKTKSTLVYTEPSKRDPSPFQLSHDDMQKRLDVFRRLKKKVRMQRDQIKINDSLYQKRIETQLVYKKKIKQSYIKIQENTVNTSRSFGRKNKSNPGNLKPVCSEGYERRSSSNRQSGPVKDESKILGLPPIRRQSVT